MGTSTENAATDGLDVRQVAYGEAAFEALCSAIADAKGGDALRPVTVVVPTKVSGLALRRRLAARPGGTAGVGFVVEAQLAELLAAPLLADRGLRPLTDQARTEVVRETLRRSPGALGHLATHPATVRVADRAFSTIREATATGGEEELLAHLAGSGGLGATLADAYREFRRMTAPTRYDEHDLATLAADAAAGSGALREVGAVIVYLPTRATPAGARLLSSLRQVTSVVVLLGATGDDAADAVTSVIGRRLAADAPVESSAAAPAAHEVTAAVVPDAEEEVRHAARIVTRAMLDGADPAQFAILYRAQEPYATLVHEVLRSAGIPHNGPTERTLAQTAAGRFLWDLWAWASDGYPRSELFDVLGSVPVRGRDDRVPTQRWDRVARQARVLGGLDHWDRRLDGFARQQEAEAEATTHSSWLADRLRIEAQDARDLREFVLGLAAQLTPPHDATWSGWSTWALRLFDEHLGRSRRGWTATDIDAEGTIRQHLANLAQLDQLRDEIGASPGSVTEADAHGTIAALLEQPAGRVGRAGTGVYVGPIGTAGATSFGHVIVLGAIEGRFPPRARENVLLPDVVVTSLRASVEPGTPLAAAAHALPTGAEHVASARQAFHRVLAASATTTITVPRADRREQRARVPAPWLLEVLSARAGRRVTVQDVLEHPETVPGLTAVHSRVAGLLDSDAAAGVGERRLQLLTHHVHAGHDLADDPIVRTTPELTRGLDVQRARSGDALTPFDGHVADAGEHLRKHLARPHSSAALAAYATCPRSYLFARVLGVRTDDEPRRWLDVDALDRGILVHDTLEHWVAETLPDATGAPDGAAPAGTPERLFELLDERIVQLEATGRVGLPALWEREKLRLRARLERWLEQDAGLRAEFGVEPVAVELGFGMDDEPLQIDTAAGVTLQLRGRIDRIDASDDRSVVVVTDYKTGKPDTYRSLADDIAQAGTELQLPTYGLAAARRYTDADIHVGYWHVHDDAKRPPVIVPFGEPERARTQQVLDALADGITNGVFFAVPGKETMWPRPGFDHCTRCPFDTICPSHAERARAADRDLRSDPARRLLPMWDADAATAGDA